MAPSNHPPITNEHALRILEAIHECEPTLASDELSPDALARVQANVDQALEHAWADVRAQAAAEAATARASARPPRRSFAGWAREALVAYLGELQRSLGSDLQLAHRKLVDLSDDELRSLIADIEDAATRGSR